MGKNKSSYSNQQQTEDVTSEEADMPENKDMVLEDEKVVDSVPEDDITSEEDNVDTDEEDIADKDVKDSPDEAADTNVNNDVVNSPEPEVLTHDVPKTITAALAIVTSTSSFKEKMDALLSSELPSVVLLVSTLLTYADNMSGKELVSSDVGASNNYNLFTRIISSCKVDNRELFKLHFHIINLTFNEFKNGAFRDLNLIRFEDKWKWGSEKLLAYRYLMTLICTLCDFGKRKENLSKISIDAALNKSKTGLDSLIISNIKSYYEV